jgi:murein DD-endopeptidase MepM/ murein hydrolase activator NlpD
MSSSKMSFTQYQGMSRFNSAPKVNFFLQSHLLTLPKLEGPSQIESRPLIRVWNSLFLGFVVSSAFGLYAHANMNDLPVSKTSDPSAQANLPTYEAMLHSEPTDHSNVLKPLTDTVEGFASQELASLDTPTTSLVEVAPPPSVDVASKSLIDQRIEPQGFSPLLPLPITRGKQLAYIDSPSPVDVTINDSHFTGEVDESELLPSVSPPLNKGHKLPGQAAGSKKVMTKGGHSNKAAKTTTNGIFQSLGSAAAGEAEDDDQALLDKILAKPRVAVGLPQALPKPSAKINDIDELISAPPSKFGSKFTLAQPNFTVPVRRLNISSRFGWRYGRMHSGIDMAAPTGSDILAANGGTVSYSGWQGGYGKTVIVDHGNGKSTRYAHCSARCVIS